MSVYKITSMTEMIFVSWKERQGEECCVWFFVIVSVCVCVKRDFGIANRETYAKEPS